MRRIINHKYLALSVTMAAVLALTGCGSVAETENTVPETAAVIETEMAETLGSTEVCVPETEIEIVSSEVELEVKSAESAKLEFKELTEIENEPSPKAETIGYTYTDMSTTMYVKSSVNIRNLPSTDGTRIGTLSTNQSVTVTGQCNETGWYRIQYANGEAYVSNKYLSGENVVTESTQTAGTEETPVYSKDPHMNMLVSAAAAQFGLNVMVFGDGRILDPNTWQQLGTVDENGQVTVCAGTSTNTSGNGMGVDSPSFDETLSGETVITDDSIAAAIEQFGPNIVIFDDGAIHDPTTWEVLAIIDSNGQITQPPTPTIIPDGFNRAAAEEIWSYVNAERTAAGLNPIAWDEEIYNFSCQRAQAIVTNYSHEGNRSDYGENIAIDHKGTAYSIHMLWYNSPGHHNNYMGERYTIGACAVYVHNGISYCVENFSRGSNGCGFTLTYREVNGQTLHVTSTEAAAIDRGSYYIASNGVVVIIMDKGSTSAYGGFIYTLEDLQAAFKEYEASQ